MMSGITYNVGDVISCIAGEPYFFGAVENKERQQSLLCVLGQYGNLILMLHSVKSLDDVSDIARQMIDVANREGFVAGDVESNVNELCRCLNRQFPNERVYRALADHDRVYQLFHNSRLRQFVECHGIVVDYNIFSGLSATNRKRKGLWANPVL